MSIKEEEESNDKPQKEDESETKPGESIEPPDFDVLKHEDDSKDKTEG